MAYWLIAAALLLVIAPVFWLAPSARDRRLARIRPVAFHHGVRVKPAVAQQDVALAALLAQYPRLQETVWTRYRLVGRLADTPKEEPVADTETGVPAAIGSVQGSWYLLPDASGEWRWEASRTTRVVPPPGVQATQQSWQASRGGHVLAIHLLPGEVAVDWDEGADEAGVRALCTEMASWLVPVVS